MPVPDSMLAARLHGWQRPLRVEEVPVPRIGAEEVLIQTAACGFTASSVRMVSPEALGSGRPADRPPDDAYPFVMGGHPVGRVVQLGPAVSGVEVGDRVCVGGQVACGVCKNCRTDQEYICLGRFGGGRVETTRAKRGPRGGAMAQYFKAPYYRLAKLPDEISFAVGSQASALANCYRAIKRSGLRPGESVIVSGATGNSGLRCVLLALAMGAGLVLAVGRNAARLKAITQLAPGRVESVVLSDGPMTERIRALTDGLGADRMVDFVPEMPEVTVEALYSLRPGGRAVLMAEGGDLTVSYAFIQKYAIEITGSSGSPYYDYGEVFGLLRRKVLSLDEVGLLPFPLTRVNEAIDLMAGRPGDRLAWSYLDLSS